MTNGYQFDPGPDRDSSPAALTTEQEFRLARFAHEITALDKDQSTELLLELMRQMMVKDNLYKEMLIKSW